MVYTSRDQIPEKYKWNLSDIFTTQEQWNTEYAQISAELDNIRSFQGQLGKREEALGALKTYFNIACRFSLLYGYAFKKHDENARDTAMQELQDRAELLESHLDEASSFLLPELTSLSEETLKGYLLHKDFEDFSVFLRDVLKKKDHVLSEKEEELLAMSTNMAGGFSRIFGMLNNSDLKLPVVKNDKGEDVQLTHGNFTVLLGNCQNQETRRAIFCAFYQAFQDNINTLAAIYGGSVKTDWFYAKARNYSSCLMQALCDEDVPLQVYDNLIESVHEHLPIMHDYMALRKKVLGLDELHIYDVYMAIVQGRDVTKDIEGAYDLVEKGLAPLGEDYISLIHKAREERWVDVYETPGKRSGAYSSGSYGTHPFVLLNYQENLDNIFTVAHELGHAMHSYIANETQPYPKAGYKIFLAEIASTTNEVLLLKHMLANTTDKDMKKTLLAHYLDMFRATVFRQTMFAEFEYITHAMEERGEPLTAQALGDQYYNLNKQYYGPSVVLDKEISYEWARIPHFYGAFYVYKYATGLISAVAIAKKILQEGKPMVEKYMEFLGAGGSDSPVEILKLAGIDLTTQDPFDFAFEELRGTLKELEELF